MSKKEKQVPLIVGDGQWGRPNDGKPYTGWTRVPATGWFGTKTSVNSWVQDGVVSSPSFTTATDGTPFSMGGWDFYKKFWKVPVNVAKSVIKAADPVLEQIGKAQIIQAEAQVEASNYAIEQGLYQIQNAPTLLDRMTPSDQPGKNLYEVRQEEIEDAALLEEYTIPSSILERNRILENRGQ